MLDSDQQRECREIAAEIVEHTLELHIAACPHGTGLAVLQAKLIGICVGVGLASGGVVFGLAKLFGG